MKVIPVVRKNDNHDNHFAWFDLSAFKQANPHLLIGYEKEYMD